MNDSAYPHHLDRRVSIRAGLSIGEKARENSSRENPA
jgi:hypothetical protein